MIVLLWKSDQYVSEVHSLGIGHLVHECHVLRAVLSVDDYISLIGRFALEIHVSNVTDLRRIVYTATYY